MTAAEELFLAGKELSRVRGLLEACGTIARSLGRESVLLDKGVYDELTARLRKVETQVEVVQVVLDAREVYEREKRRKEERS